MKCSWLFLRLNELRFGKKKERKNRVQADNCTFVGGKTDGINYGTSSESQRIRSG